MTREEYEHYTTCRQASFTWRKGQSCANPARWDSILIITTAKRFREFLNLPPHLDLRSNDDTVDIVGFLAFEMVRSLTLSGLSVKRSLEDRLALDEPVNLGKRKDPFEQSPAKRRRSPEPQGNDPPPLSSLFLPPPEARTAMRPEHIYDAFARMQSDWTHLRSAGMRNWRGGLRRTTVSMI